MSITGLINGQTLEIDNHIRGCNLKFKWNEAVHLHKRMNGNKRFNYAEVIIPLYGKGNWEFRKIKGNSESIEKQLKKKIKDAFSNPSIRDSFIKSFYSEIVSKLKACDINDKYEQEKIICNSLELIGQYFRVKPKIKDKIESSVNNLYRLESYGEESLFMRVDANRQNDFYSLTVGNTQKEVELEIH